MIHGSDWFEMSDKRKPRLATASWVPLFARRAQSELEFAEPGYWEEYFGAVAILFPSDCQHSIDTIEWMEANRTDRRPQVEDEEFIPAKSFFAWKSGLQGEFLVLRSSFETGDTDEVIIDPDLILGLRLRPEGNCWVSPHEDYTEVIRIQKDHSGRVVLVEIRGEFLRDYLCARNSGLLVVTFQSRTEISDVAPNFTLANPWKDVGTRWEGRINEVDESGAPYGTDVALMTVGRTDVEPEDDVPVMDFASEGNTWSSQQEFVRLGPKRYYVLGEMWRNEWIEPGSHSPRIRGDREESTAEFVIDNTGHRVKAAELVSDLSRWLWFRPAVMNELLSHRGTRLIWYTEFTGSISLPAEGRIHFGVNSQGLVNVYAKDIGELRTLWQKFWVPYNVSPDGKVCRELLASQMEARPADTVAPEMLLAHAVSLLDTKFAEEFGQRFYQDHAAEQSIWRNAHRFIAVDDAGFYRLMKELTRLCIERIDLGSLKVLTPKLDKGVGSLKRIERLLDERGFSGRDAVRELVGIYELRHADSHLPSSDLESALSLVGVNAKLSTLNKGTEAIARVAQCLIRIAQALQHPRLSHEVAVPS